MPIYIHMYVRVSKGTAQRGKGEGGEEEEEGEGGLYLCM